VPIGARKKCTAVLPRRIGSKRSLNMGRQGWYYSYSEKLEGTRNKKPVVKNTPYTQERAIPKTPEPLKKVNFSVNFLNNHLLPIDKLSSIS
jgi:hypothetical protein